MQEDEWVPGFSVRERFPWVKRTKGLQGSFYIFKNKNSFLSSTPILLSLTLIKCLFIIFLSGLHDPENGHECLVKMLISCPLSASCRLQALLILVSVIRESGEEEQSRCPRKGLDRRIQWHSHENRACGEGHSPLPQRTQHLVGDGQGRAVWGPLGHQVGSSARGLIRAHQKLPFVCRNSLVESSSWPTPNSKAFPLARETSGF